MKNLLLILILTIGTAASTLGEHRHRNVLRSCGESYCYDDDDDDRCYKKAKLNITLTSGNIDLGNFVKGCNYEFEQPDNELEFEITANKAKNFWVSFSTDQSDVGSADDVQLFTEWRYSTDCGYHNCFLECLGMHFFKKKLIVGCFVNEVHVHKNARSGERIFTQVLSLQYMF